MSELLRPVPRKDRERAEYASLGLSVLFDQLGEGCRHGILDLGPALGANVDYLSRFPCKFFVADVFRSLEGHPLNRAEDDADWSAVFAKLLPYEQGTCFDLILAWDVLNYLRRSQILGLARHVGEFCRPGTLLFALLSTRKEIPARPRSYHIAGRDRLLYQSSTQAVRSCPLYREPELLRLMPGFHVRTTFLLRNGMQEYLMRYEPVRV